MHHGANIVWMHEVQWNTSIRIEDASFNQDTNSSGPGGASFRGAF